MNISKELKQARNEARILDHARDILDDYPIDWDYLDSGHIEKWELGGGFDVYWNRKGTKEKILEMSNIFASDDGEIESYGDNWGILSI